MQLKTILNFVQPFKSFVYKNVRFVEDESGQPVEIEIGIEPRKNSRAVCSGCGEACSGYDHEQTPGRFEFVPLWGIAVFFAYRMRRVGTVSPRLRASNSATVGR